MTHSSRPACIRLADALLCGAIVAGVVAPLARGAHKSRITGTPTNELAEQVLHNLLSSPLGKTMPPLRWEFFLIDDNHISASSDAAGRIFVTAGMSRWYLGKVPGVWAAVLGHEVGHGLILSPAYWLGFQAELDKIKRQVAAPQAAQVASRPLLAFTGKGSLFNVRNAKQREYAADYIAMMLMAEAGYHPEYALALDQWFSGSIFDTSRPFAFLTTHPTWQLRSERAHQNYDMALAIFNSHWPDAAKSPGGIAPPAGKLGSITVEQSTDSSELLISVPFSASKAEGVVMRVVAVFVAGRVLVPSKDPRFRSPDGPLELNESFPGAASLSPEVSFRLPVAALDTRESKLRLAVFLTAGEQVLAVRYLPVEVNLAKN